MLVSPTACSAGLPPPQGLRDPLGFSDEIATLPAEDQELVMG